MLNCLLRADKMGSMCLTIKYLGVVHGEDKEGWRPFAAFYFYVFGRRPAVLHAAD